MDIYVDSIVNYFKIGEIETLKIPNGIIKIKYDVNVEDKIIFKQTLAKVVQINKVFIIPEECDYSKFPK